MSVDKTSYEKLRQIEHKISVSKTLDRDEISFLRINISKNSDDELVSHMLSCFQFIGDPAHKDVIEPFIYTKNPALAGRALWTLCWLGYANHYKSYILEAVEPGFAWDVRRYVAAKALRGVGLHLKTNRDRDFSQLIMRWITRDEDDDFYLSPPPGASQTDLEASAHTAKTAAGIAMGAESMALIEDDTLLDSCVARFIAERQDG